MDTSLGSDHVGATGMRRQGRRLATLRLGIGIALTLTLGAGCEGERDDIPPRYRALAAAVEQERIASNTPGVAIAIIEGGELTFSRGFGTKGPDQVEPVKPSTLFRIGSRTKALTAIALLQAVQDGRADLDHPLVEYVPAFHLARSPDPVPQITLRHLLTHTSGIADYVESNAPAGERDDAALEGFLTGRFGELGYIQTPPGALFAYANPNYSLAGLVAEKVTGVAYRQLMRERVFAPLGMQRTVFLPSEVLADGDYANGKACEGMDCRAGAMVKTNFPQSYDTPWGRPAGFAWSSVEELASFADFLLHGNEAVLRDDLRLAMVSAQTPMQATAGLGSYGFGNMMMWGIRLSTGEAYELPSVSHGGSIPGYSTTFFCIPAREFCFISLANADGAAFDESLEVAIQTLVDLPAPAVFPDIAPKPERFPAYAGTYVDPFEVGELRVTVDAAGRLAVDIPFLDAQGTPYTRELQPVATDNFVINVDGTQMPLTFIADGTGTYVYAYSRPYVAVRVPAP